MFKYNESVTNKITQIVDGLLKCSNMISSSIMFNYQPNVTITLCSPLQSMFFLKKIPSIILKINQIILNKMYGIPSQDFHKLKKPMVQIYHVQFAKLFQCMLFSFLVHSSRDTVATTC